MDSHTRGAEADGLPAGARKTRGARIVLPDLLPVKHPDCDFRTKNVPGEGAAKGVIRCVQYPRSS